MQTQYIEELRAEIARIQNEFTQLREANAKARQERARATMTSGELSPKGGSESDAREARAGPGGE